MNYDDWSSEKKVSWTVISKSSCENQQNAVLLLHKLCYCKIARGMLRALAANFFYRGQCDTQCITNFSRSVRIHLCVLCEQFAYCCHLNRRNFCAIFFTDCITVIAVFSLTLLMEHRSPLATVAVYADDCTITSSRAQKMRTKRREWKTKKKVKNRVELQHSSSSLLCVVIDANFCFSLSDAYPHTIPSNGFAPMTASQSNSNKKKTQRQTNNCMFFLSIARSNFAAGRFYAINYILTECNAKRFYVHPCDCVSFMWGSHCEHQTHTHT